MSRVACEGWWEQEGFGRQPMEQLQLAFDDGNVSGSGADIIGLFSFSGRIDGESVVLVKQYIEQHHVDYIGNFDGEGTLQGTWHIGPFRGAWAIKIISILEERDIQQISKPSRR